MDGFTLDKEIRRIFTTVTAETSLTATAELVTLGFGPTQAFEMICKILEKRPYDLYRCPALNGKPAARSS